MSPQQEYRFARREGVDVVEGGLEFQPKFDDNGLIPAIVSGQGGEVLMFAWMNDEALWRTIDTGEAHFWSRSRGKLWRKGEESGNTLSVREIKVDCDQDVIWLICGVGGDGNACHTGMRSCFYRSLEANPKNPTSIKLTKDC